MNPAPIQTYTPIRGMIICVDGGDFVQTSDYQALEKEVEYLRAYVGGEMLRSDYPTAADMRAELDNAHRSLVAETDTRQNLWKRVFDLLEAAKDTGFIDKHGVRIREGDKINFSTHGHTHGPEREDYKDAEVWWCEEDGCWAFGKYVVPDSIVAKGCWREGEIMKGYTWHFTLQDDIDRASLEIVSNT